MRYPQTPSFCLGFAVLLLRTVCMGGAEQSHNDRFPEMYCSPECTRTCSMHGTDWSMDCAFATTAKYTKFDRAINPYITNNTHMAVRRTQEHPGIDTLYLRDLRLEDNGVYRCTGINAGSTAVFTRCKCLAVSMNLSDHQRCEEFIRPRIFPTNLTNFTVFEGRPSLILPCFWTAHGFNFRNFWSHNECYGQLRRETGEILQLVNITRGDAGRYTCELRTTGAKTILDRIDFYVTVIHVDRNFTVSYPIRELGTRVLNCSLSEETGAVNRTLAWFQDGTRIITDTKGAFVAPNGTLYVDFSKLVFRRSTELTCTVQGQESHLKYDVTHLPPLTPGRPGREGDFIVVKQHRDLTVMLVVNARFREGHLSLATSHVILRRIMRIDPRSRLRPEEACYLWLHGKSVDVTVTLQYRNRNGDVSPPSEPTSWIYKPNRAALNYHTVSMYMLQRPNSCRSNTSSGDDPSSVETVALSWYNHIKKLLSVVCSCCTVTQPLALNNRNPALCPMQTDKLYNCSGSQSLTMKVQFEVSSPIEITNLRKPIIMNVEPGKDWEVQGSGAFSYGGICVDGPFHTQTCHGQTGFDSFIQFTTGLCTFKDGHLLQESIRKRQTEPTTPAISSSDARPEPTIASTIGQCVFVLILQRILL